MYQILKLCIKLTGINYNVHNIVQCHHNTLLTVSEHIHRFSFSVLKFAKTYTNLASLNFSVKIEKKIRTKV